jgi:DNA polymerase I-like protein with 3'-5' exonuclease and polymerase domains
MEPLMAQIAEGMRAAADLLVPLEVSVGHGADWLQAHG